jgi:hypothetical protein
LFSLLFWRSSRYHQSVIDTHVHITRIRNGFGISYTSNDLRSSLDYDWRKWHQFLDTCNWFNDCIQWQHIDDICIHRYHNEEM